MIRPVQRTFLTGTNHCPIFPLPLRFILTHTRAHSYSFQLCPAQSLLLSFSYTHFYPPRSLMIWSSPQMISYHGIIQGGGIAEKFKSPDAAAVSMSNVFTK